MSNTEKMIIDNDVKECVNILDGEIGKLDAAQKEMTQAQSRWKERTGAFLNATKWFGLITATALLADKSLDYTLPETAKNDSVVRLVQKTENAGLFCTLGGLFVLGSCALGRGYYTLQKDLNNHKKNRLYEELSLISHAERYINTKE